jgi:hypothetical protein
MALSFLYFTTRRLLGMLLGRFQSEHAKDVEIACKVRKLDRGMRAAGSRTVAARYPEASVEPSAEAILVLSKLVYLALRRATSLLVLVARGEAARAPAIPEHDHRPPPRDGDCRPHRRSVYAPHAAPTPRTD